MNQNMITMNVDCVADKQIFIHIYDTEYRLLTFLLFFFALYAVIQNV